MKKGRIEAEMIFILQEPNMVSVEEHRSLGGSIISRLDNGAFVGLIYELLVFSKIHVEVVPPVTTHPCRNA